MATPSDPRFSWKALASASRQEVPPEIDVRLQVRRRIQDQTDPSLLETLAAPLRFRFAPAFMALLIAVMVTGATWWFNLATQALSEASADNAIREYLNSTSDL
jgi:anti-sigma factor RsiW